MGGVSGNLVANYIQTSLDSYRRWVWVSFGIALMVAIAAAIRDARGDTYLLPERHTDGARGGVVNVGEVKDGAIITSVTIVDSQVSGGVHIHARATSVVTSLRQLPVPVSDFTGREDELAELTAKAVQDGLRVASLHGLGGVGKTALAIKLADQLKSHYPDAQLFLDLKGASREPLPIIDALRHVIRSYHPTAKLPESEAELRGLYLSVLQGQRAILLMDNAFSAEQVEPLIPPRGCILLITSRQHFTFAGLFAKNLEVLSPDDACKLLLAIAPRIDVLANQIAGLCGYLPLALRLAGGALMKYVNLSTADYVRRLQDGQQRLQLIEASLDLSYQMLSEELQRSWRLLAVFPDTFEERAASAVWSTAVDKSQDVLAELIAASMVEWNGNTRRYRLHDLARLFAYSHLRNDERTEGQRQYAAHYMTVLSVADALYREGGESFERGLALFDLEWRNIADGQSWAAAQADADDCAAGLCIGYANDGANLLGLRQDPRDNIRWLQVALAAVRRLKERRTYECAALGNLGNRYEELGESKLAIECYEQALIIARELGNREAEGDVFGGMGNVYAAMGDTRRAIALFEQRLIIAREIGDRRGEGNALGSLGLAFADLGETKRAVEAHEQRLIIAREIGDRRGEGNALGNLGLAFKALGKMKRAIDFYDQQLVIVRKIGDGLGEGNALWNKSVALDKLGKRTQAIACAEEALNIYERIEYPDVAKVRKRLAEWRS